MVPNAGKPHTCKHENCRDQISESQEPLTFIVRGFQLNCHNPMPFCCRSILLFFVGYFQCGRKTSLCQQMLTSLLNNIGLKSANLVGKSLTTQCHSFMREGVYYLFQNYLSTHPSTFIINNTTTQRSDFGYVHTAGQGVIPNREFFLLHPIFL